MSLTLAGVAAHGGQPAPMALHAVLALLAAAVILWVERLLGSAGRTLAEAIAAADRLAGAAPPGIAPPAPPLPAPRARAHRARAPPPAVAF